MAWVVVGGLESRLMKDTSSQPIDDGVGLNHGPRGLIQFGLTLGQLPAKADP